MTSKEFIYEYLKADQDTGAGSYEKMMSHIKDFDWSEVKQSILKLRYYYFLKTSYWLIISNEVKRRSDWKCSSCKSRENLEVHHGDEGNIRHGEEHLIIDKLVCLCKKCHGKLKKSSIKNVEKRVRRINKKQNILSQIPYYPLSIPEESISGSSFSLKRLLLEELEHERKIIIDRDIYEGWKIHRC